jgi:hypothetical protein
MHGLRVIGAVQTDINGEDYYVYPGSAAATSFFSETPVAKILFGSEASLPVGLSLTDDVKHTLPGFGDQMGVPSAGPFIGVALEMLVQGKTFATGVSDAHGNVPRFGESVLEVPVTASAFRMARQAFGMMKGTGGGTGKIAYELKGKLNGSAFSTVRFQNKGEFEMPTGAASGT